MKKMCTGERDANGVLLHFLQRTDMEPKVCFTQKCAKARSVLSWSPCFNQCCLNDFNIKIEAWVQLQLQRKASKLNHTDGDATSMHRQDAHAIITELKLS